MSKLSLLDKLSLFIDVAKDSVWSVLILLFLIVLVYIFSGTNKKTMKRNKIIYIVFSLLILIILFICYLPSIGKIFDNMMNNLFIVIYFPSLAVYFAAIIVTSIILWISLFNYKTSEIIKRLNLVIYLIINYLFALLLYTINDNKLDIFNTESIYGNKQATALIELTSIIFVVWIIFLTVYKIVLTYVRRDYRPEVKKVLVKQEVKKLPDNYLNIEVPNMVYGNISKPKKEEKNYSYTNAPSMVYGKVSIKNVKPYIEIEAPKLVYGSIPKKYSINNKTKTYEDMLTLEDYKLLLKLLKEQKLKEKKEVIKPNFTELENLFRSIR
ncbi:MAG: MnhB domain-containing protein [Bacilli bacterium]|nr:MnhB domain-containing protein [Bacilli bacterium]